MGDGGCPLVSAVAGSMPSSGRHLAARISDGTQSCGRRRRPGRIVVTRQNRSNDVVGNVGIPLSLQALRSAGVAVLCARLGGNIAATIGVVG
jgi:hypothetical protein